VPVTRTRKVAVTPTTAAKDMAKKETVENAILDLAKKHPDVKVHKARLLAGEKTARAETLKGQK